MEQASTSQDTTSMTETLHEETSSITLPGCDSSSSGVTAAPDFDLDYNVVSVLVRIRKILIWEMERNGYSVGVASGSMKIVLMNLLLVKMEKRECAQIVLYKQQNH